MLGGYVGPIAISVVMLVAASAAGVARALLRASLLLSLPIAISVVLVSVFTRPGTTVILTIGPFDATLEGVDFAAQTLVRLLAISLSIGLFILTTEARAFVLDLERRGVPPRFAFVALATIEAVPTRAPSFKDFPVGSTGCEGRDSNPHRSYPTSTSS